VRQRADPVIIVTTMFSYIFIITLTIGYHARSSHYRTLPHSLHCKLRLLYDHDKKAETTSLLNRLCSDNDFCNRILGVDL